MNNDLQQSNMEITYESEFQLGQLFTSLGAAFARLAKGMDPAKEQQELKDITTKLTRAKGLIREFEKEARADDVRPSEIAARKRELTEQLNEFLDLKKQHAAIAQSRAALFGAQGSPADEPKHSRYDKMSTQQMIDSGKKQIKEVDSVLKRSEKVVEDTIAIATTTAETLQKQTEQLERTLDNLDEVHFTLKKAKQVIRDITRGIATDKCIMALTMLSLVALIALILIKVLHIGQHKAAAKQAVQDIAAKVGITNTGRRMLGSRLLTNTAWRKVTQAGGAFRMNVS